MNTKTRILAAALWLPALLQAQTAPGTSSTPARETERPLPPLERPVAPDDETVTLDSFEVTGTRLRTLGDEATAIPVFSLPQIELERRGVSRLADIRRAIPQLGAAIGFNDNLMNSGPSRAQSVGTSFNMRGLGGNSTLVLIDGRRIPHTGQEAPGGAGGREDFSVDGIPVSAIERIDILPQGAGAIYGSEAIAGVVNIILKKNYSGAELRVTYDNTFDTDVAQTTVALTAGYRVGKLSTFLSASWEKQNGLADRDRWWTATNDASRFGGERGGFVYNNTAGAGSLSTAWYPAVANHDPADPSSPELIPGLSTHVVLIPSGSNGSNSAYVLANKDTVPLYDSALHAMTVDPARRQNVLWRASYRLAAQVELYGDVRWSEFENRYTGPAPTLTTELPALTAGNPFNTPVYLSKVFYDQPRVRTVSAQQNMGANLGVRGDFFAGWRYDVGASWSRNIVKDDQIVGQFYWQTVSNALASGTPPILAYDSLNGTDPNAPGVLDALRPTADHKDTTDVYQYLVTVDGTIWSGWAGDIRAAFGAEAGEEKVKFWREPSPITPSYVLTRPFSRRHTAAFAEVGIPLLSEKQNLPLVYRVEVGGAVRATDYSDIGSVTTPTYRALFQPVKWLTFRGSRAEGFKPVRLYDLQGPVQELTSTYTAARNVRDPFRGNELVLGTYRYRSGGNPLLKPEESVSRNAGVVFDVPGSALKGLSFSADYYEINYTERSGTTSLQTLLNYFPERIFREPLTPADAALGYTAGIIRLPGNDGALGWDSSNINLAGVRTKGWDFRATYSRTFDFGDVFVTTAYTRPELIVTQSTPAATPDSTYGHQPDKFSGSVFWAKGPWDVGVSVNYQSRYFIGGVNDLARSYPSFIEWNPQVSYNFGSDTRFGRDASTWWGRWLAGSKVTVTIVNALNKEPSLADAANSRFVGDQRLRRYILSLSKKF